MVPFVSQQLNNLDLALAMARRGNLPGAEGLVAQQFERLFSSGQYKEAAEVAAESPQGVLRTKEVRALGSPPRPRPRLRRRRPAPWLPPAWPRAVAQLAARWSPGTRGSLPMAQRSRARAPQTTPAPAPQVVERLKSVPPTPGQKPPILVYLGVLLQRGKLNALESAELAR